MASNRAFAFLISSREITCFPRSPSRAVFRAIRTSIPTARRSALRLPFVTSPTSSRLFSSSSCVHSNSSSQPSGQSPDQPLKQWTFEDINASLKPTSKPTILIDVREPAELLSTGTIPTSLCIPLASQPDAFFLSPDEFLTRFGFSKPGTGNVEDATADLVFFCKAGVRARAAAELAVQAGYEKERIGVYDGSWLDWEKKGGKSEKWDGE